MFERKEKKVKTKEEEFVDRLVNPHKKVSREVKESDLSLLIEDAHVLYNLCYMKVGMYFGGEAMAHPQINDKHPLRFFVTKNKKLVINPIIKRHSNYEVDSVEGCLTFPSTMPKTVKRWQKCEVEASILTEDGKIGERQIFNLSGKEAWVWQHETQHLGDDNFKSMYIYEEKDWMK